MQILPLYITKRTLLAAQLPALDLLDALVAALHAGAKLGLLLGLGGLGGLRLLLCSGFGSLRSEDAGKKHAEERLGDAVDLPSAEGRNEEEEVPEPGGDEGRAERANPGEVDPARQLTLQHRGISSLDALTCPTRVR